MLLLSFCSSVFQLHQTCWVVCVQHQVLQCWAVFKSLNVKSIKTTRRCFLSSSVFVLKDQNQQPPEPSCVFAFSESGFLVIFLKT